MAYEVTYYAASFYLIGVGQLVLDHLSSCESVLRLVVQVRISSFAATVVEARQKIPYLR